MKANPHGDRHAGAKNDFYYGREGYGMVYKFYVNHEDSEDGLSPSLPDSSLWLPPVDAGKIPPIEELDKLIYHTDEAFGGELQAITAEDLAGDETYHWSRRQLFGKATSEPPAMALLRGETFGSLTADTALGRHSLMQLEDYLKGVRQPLPSSHGGKREPLPADEVASQARAALFPGSISAAQAATWIELCGGDLSAAVEAAEGLSGSQLRLILEYQEAGLGLGFGDMKKLAARDDEIPVHFFRKILASCEDNLDAAIEFATTAGVDSVFEHAHSVMFTKPARHAFDGPNGPIIQAAIEYHEAGLGLSLQEAKELAVYSDSLTIDTVRSYLELFDRDMAAVIEAFTEIGEGRLQAVLEYQEAGLGLSLQQAKALAWRGDSLTPSKFKSYLDLFGNDAASVIEAVEVMGVPRMQLILEYHEAGLGLSLQDAKELCKSDVLPSADTFRKLLSACGGDLETAIEWAKKIKTDDLQRDVARMTLGHDTTPLLNSLLEHYNSDSGRSLQEAHQILIANQQRENYTPPGPMLPF